MPPRNPELPEGTDHIVNGALETGDGANASASHPPAKAPAAGDGGFVGTGESDDTGGFRQQLKQGAANLQSQAGGKAREFAETGKDRATNALGDFSKVIGDAADSIDERLGGEYGEYARKAADAVAGFADTLRNKNVDELLDDGRELVRKSPGAAIGVAAVVGFTLVRLFKAGLESRSDDNMTASSVNGKSAGGKARAKSKA